MPAVPGPENEEGPSRPGVALFLRSSLAP